MAEEKTHWKNGFNINYLGSYSLDGGKDVVLTISKIVKEEVTGANGRKEECTVAYFNEKDDWIKPMIMNRTNCKAVEKLYKTPYIQDWAGKKVQIGIAKVSAFGDEVDALRIRNKVPTGTKPELKPDMPAWENAVEAIKTKKVKIEQVTSKYSLSAENLKKLTDAAA